MRTKPMSPQSLVLVFVYNIFLSRLSKSQMAETECNKIVLLWACVSDFVSLIQTVKTQIESSDILQRADK